MTIIPLILLAAAPVGSDSTYADWYQSLVSPTTHGHCCGMADCRHPEGYKIEGGVRKVEFGGQWLDVPPETVIPTMNPTGQVVACVVAGTVICFIGVSET